MKDLDAAAKAYTRCLESNPSFLAAYIGRGDVYADAGDHEAAKQQYLLALEQNPDCVEAIVHLGYNLQVTITLLILGCNLDALSHIYVSHTQFHCSLFLLLFFLLSITVFFAAYDLVTC